MSTESNESLTYEMASEALHLVKLGRVFPVWNIRDGACACPASSACAGAGKHPMGHLVTRGLVDATRDTDTIRRWWALAPNANIGLVPECYFVLDEDPRHGGTESLERLVAEFGPLPRTLTAVTGSGGHHIFYRYPVGRNVRNSANALGASYPGLDTRAGERGYVVAAPSTHKSGNRYRWLFGCAPGEVEVASAPEWLIERVIEKPRTKAEPPKVQREITEVERRRARGLLEWAANEVACADEGTRNDTLFKMAAMVGHWVGAGYLDRFEAEAAMENAGSACGLGDREVEQTLANGLDCGVSEPLGLPDDQERKREWMIERGLLARTFSLDELRAQRPAGGER